MSGEARRHAISHALRRKSATAPLPPELLTPSPAKALVMNPPTHHPRPRPRPATLRQALRRGVFAALSVAAGGALGFACTIVAIEAGLMPDLTIKAYSSPSGGSPATDAVVHESHALAAAHDCWTGSDDMPADMRGEVPGHVVATRANAERPTYSAAMVAPALDQVFGTAADNGLIVHAFCR